MSLDRQGAEGAFWNVNVSPVQSVISRCVEEALIDAANVKHRIIREAYTIRQEAYTRL